MLHRQPKRSLSFHQKQNRFFAIALVLLAVVAFTAFIWLTNRSALSVH